MSVLMASRDRARVAADVLNILACIYSVALLGMNLRYVGLIVFEKPWVYFDIFYVVILSGISGNQLYTEFTPYYNNNEHLLGVNTYD